MRCFGIAILIASLGSLSLNAAWKVSDNKPPNLSAHRPANLRKMASWVQTSASWKERNENNNTRLDRRNRYKNGEAVQPYPVGRMPHNNANDRLSDGDTKKGGRKYWKNSGRYNDRNPSPDKTSRIVESSRDNRAWRGYWKDNDRASRVNEFREEGYRELDRGERRYARRAERNRRFNNRWDDDSFGFGGYGGAPWFNPGFMPIFLLQAYNLPFYFPEMAGLYPALLMILPLPLMPPPPPPPPPPMMPPPPEGIPFGAEPLPYAQ